MAFSKHWNCKFRQFQNICILNFGISTHSNSKFWLFPIIGIPNFAFSKHWNYKFRLFRKIRILNFASSKHWNFKFRLFSKIGILNFPFFQTLEFWILAFPKIGVLVFSFSKDWNLNSIAQSIHQTSVCDFLVMTSLLISSIWSTARGKGVYVILKKELFIYCLTTIFIPQSPRWMMMCLRAKGLWWYS